MSGICYLIFFLVTWNFGSSDLSEFLLRPVIGKTIVWFLGGCAFFNFAWMATSYFRRVSQIRNAIAWGWFLFIGNFVAGILYFYFVYRPGVFDTEVTEPTQSRRTDVLVGFLVGLATAGLLFYAYWWEPATF